MLRLWLLQRHKRGRSLPEPHLTATYSPDYMGNAEFEFGAFPKNITNMYEHLDNFQRAEVEVFEFHKPVKVYVFYSDELIAKRYDDYVPGAYLPEVKKLSKPGEIRLKGYSDFPGTRSFPEKGVYNIIAWTDIQNGVFITLDDLSLDAFKSMIKRQISVQQRK